MGTGEQPTGGVRQIDVGPARCSFCGYRVPTGRTEDGEPARFCTDYCRAAIDDWTPFAGRQGFKRFRPGVAVLEELLPAGFPADACVLLSADAGGRRAELETELVWRALERGEPAVVVSYDVPPGAVVERFLAADWNVLPHLAADRLRIVDCLTSRLADRGERDDRGDEWNEFLGELAAPRIETVDDPADVREVADALYGCLDDLEMRDSGVVVIDPLNELTRIVREVRAVEFVSDLRAGVAKRRFVPVVIGVDVRPDRERDAAPHDYRFDGVLDVRLADDLLEGARVRQLAVRKMTTVPYRPEWVAFETVRGRGAVPFDPFREFDEMYGPPGP